MSEKKTHFPIFDRMRALAILTIVVYHLLQEIFGVGFLIKADGIWNNLGRLKIFGDQFLLNMLTAPFAYGFAAVSVFIVLSGFGLRWSLIGREKISWKEFYQRRFSKLLIPFYLVLLISILLLMGRNWLFPNLSWWPNYSWLDWLKYLFPPLMAFDMEWMQQIEGAFWFMALILQLYLVFPLLQAALIKMGSRNFLLMILVATLSYRFIATYWLSTAPLGVVEQKVHSYYGFVFFLPRLFEFSLGMVLAEKLKEWQEIPSKWLSGWAFMVGLGLTALGVGLNYWQFGWIFSDLIAAIGVFAVFLNIATWLRKLVLLEKIGGFSYEIYLLHHQLLKFIFLPLILLVKLPNSTIFWLTLPAYLAISTIAGYLVNRISKKVV